MKKQTDHEKRDKTVRAQLLFDLKEGRYAQCDRLPPESILSEQMGISRTQLRDALANLEREGFIARRHGVGTIINRHVLSVQTRMDIEVEFLDMIRQGGYTPGVAFVRSRTEPADPVTAEKLHIPSGTPVLRVCRLCTADGEPAIYCEDVVCASLIHGEYTSQDLELPVFHFLQQFCGTECYLDLTELHAVSADKTLSEIFQVPLHTPLLNMEEVDFDIEGTPVLYSSQFFIDQYFHHTVLRKKF